MSKRKILADEGEGGGDGWLTSYADMMTLIACFFILMMAFANYDPPGFQVKAKIISESFKKKGGGPIQTDLSQLNNEIVNHPDFDERTKMTLKDGELEIVFTGSASFPEGQYRLQGGTLKLLDNLIDIIKSQGKDFRILIEGHADKNEILVGNNMNHWSLSAARAARVIARFEYFGFDARNMVSVARGDRAPLEGYEEKPKNKKEIKRRKRNAKLNRRVVIKVLEPLSKTKVRMGLGILFRDAAEDVPSEDPSINNDTLFK